MHLTRSALRAYIEGEISQAETEQATEHLGICEKCQSRMESIDARRQRIDELLNRQSVYYTCEDAVLALRLLHAKAAQVEPESACSPFGSPVPRWAWLLLLCALVLAGAGTAIYKTTAPRWKQTSEQGKRIASGGRSQQGGNPAVASTAAEVRTLGSTGAAPRIARPELQVPGHEGGGAVSSLKEAPKFRIHGQVVSQTGLPAAGVRFTVVPRDAEQRETVLAQTVSDREGRYELTLDYHPDLMIEVIAESTEYVDFFALLRMKSPGEFLRNFPAFSPVSSLAGTVKDENGQPVEGAELTVSVSADMDAGSAIQGRETKISSVAIVRKARTDRNGRYEIAELPEKNLWVAVRKPMHQHAFRQSSLAAGVNTWDFCLIRGSEIAFLVRDSNGKPVSNASASARSQDQNISGESDAAGLLRLRVLPGTREFPLKIAANNYLDKVAQINPNSPPKEVVMSAGPIFGCLVVDPEGRPLADAEVSLMRTTEQGQEGMITESEGQPPQTTDSEGRFTYRLSAIPGGNVYFTVEASHRNYTGHQRAVIETLKELDETLVLTFRKPEGAVQGQVIDSAGNPVSEFSVVISDPHDHTDGFGLRAMRGFSFVRGFDSQDGWFSVPGLPSGPFTLTLFSQPGKAALSKQMDIRIEKGQTLDLGVIRFDPPPSIPGDQQ